MVKKYIENLMKEKSFEDEEDFEEEIDQIEYKSNEYLFEKRLIPLGRIISNGRPYFFKYPKINDATYNVYTYVSEMGFGKTCSYSVTIITKEYGVITAKEMYDLFHQGKEIHVLSYQDNAKPIWSKVTDAMYSGEKELHEVIVEGGSRIQVSMDHIMLVWRDGIKSVRLKDVTTDDWVLFPKKIDSLDYYNNISSKIKPNKNLNAKLKYYYRAKIRSIESIGIEKAYDFEVKAKNLLAGDGCGMFVHNSTNVRNFIYFLAKTDNTINIIFDPMKMEFAKLAICNNTPEKRKYLLNEILTDPETNRKIHLNVRPDKLPIFHLIPRFALIKRIWEAKTRTYRVGYDHTTLSIIKKDGGFVFAEDISSLTPEQIFNVLNYRDLRSEQATHFFIRAAYRICNQRFSPQNWYIEDFIKVLREGVKQFRGLEDIENYNEAMDDNNKGLSSSELELIENLEKYKEAKFFVENQEERKKYCRDWRDFIKLNRTLNISFLGYKKTEKIGIDMVVGQTDVILERLIEISNEYYEGVRKKEQGYNLTPWESYLMQNWNVNLYFEESEIFIPRDVAQTQIKKVPCLRRLDYLMSFGRKYGFRNFMYVTQRIGKVHPIIFKESNNIFLGPLIGEDRDQILSDFGVSKLKFKIPTTGGVFKELLVKDVVTTLNKQKHEWLFISKATKSVAAIQTYDSPVG